MLIIFFFFSLEHKEFLIIGGPKRGLNLIIILFWSTTFFFSTSIFFFSTLTFILRQAPPPAQSLTLFPISYFAVSLQSIVTRWSLSRLCVSSSSTSSIRWLVKLRCAFLRALSSLPTVGKPNRGSLKPRRDLFLNQGSCICKTGLLAFNYLQFSPKNYRFALLLFNLAPHF